MHKERLETERLVLRCYRLADVAAIQVLCDDWEIARTTLNIPHPYTEEDAQGFVQRVVDNDNPNTYQFAITLKDDTLIGATGIHRTERHHHAEIGYWIGRPYWGQGYATEAVQRLIQFGFEQMDLNRIFAGYFSENWASRRVMEKAGLSYEGLFRQHYYRWDQYFDAGYCGIVREDWQREYH